MAIQKDKQKISPNSDNPGCITIPKRRCDTASEPGGYISGCTPAACDVSLCARQGTPAWRCKSSTGPVAGTVSWTARAVIVR